MLLGECRIDQLKMEEFTLWSLEPGKTVVGNIARALKLRRGESFAVVRLCDNVSQRQQKGGGSGTN